MITCTALFDTLLAATREAYLGHPETRAFAPFPADVTPQEVAPFSCPPAALLRAEAGFFTDRYAALQQAIVAAGDIAQWRETYKDTDIGQDFMDRFGCYTIIGPGGPFTSNGLRAWVVYMPPGLHYPWHHHPAEELYLVLSGSALFLKRGHPEVILNPGDTAFHASNQPHAMETGAYPVLCLVVWRDGFDAGPVLTPVT